MDQRKGDHVSMLATNGLVSAAVSLDSRAARRRRLPAAGAVPVALLTLGAVGALQTGDSQAAVVP
ncbi:MAG: hypothetical protein ACRDL5_03760, partial [Solirubrobacteraceae bacterium]